MYNAGTSAPDHSNRAHLDVLEQWTLLCPGQQHPLAKVEKQELLDGLSGYLRVSNCGRADASRPPMAMAEKSVDRCVRIADNITELGGLIAYNVDRGTAGLALYDNNQLSSGRDGVLIKAIRASGIHKAWLHATALPPPCPLPQSAARPMAPPRRRGGLGGQPGLARGPGGHHHRP